MGNTCACADQHNQKLDLSFAVAEPEGANGDRRGNQKPAVSGNHNVVRQDYYAEQAGKNLN